ncbi:MAG: sugar ABC transporter ATP-binding protein [Cryobacterium sp.]
MQDFDSSRAPMAISAMHIEKRFGGALALDDVSLRVAPGERHAVVGENGAGKSTLMRILSGMLSPDAGRVEVNGAAMNVGARASLDAGVSLVHQELSLVPEMSVAENIMLGSTPSKLGFIRYGKQRDIARDALREVGVDIDLDENVGRLSVASRQFVEIARAIARRPRVLILDEPTATLTPAETDHLMTMLVRLSEQGIALLYISHRLPEIFQLCSRATVLRDGKLVASLDLAESSTTEVIDKMVGRDLADDLASRRTGVPGKVVLSARHVSAPRVNDVSLEVRAGEIVGIGGLVGAGRTEIVRAIIGADTRTHGTVSIADGTVTHQITSYTSAVKAGVAYIPEDRRAEGLALGMTVSENIALPNRAQLTKGGLLNRGKTVRLVTDIIKDVGLRPPQPHREVGQLSGGNQQKVVIGKWLATQPRVIVLDEPTRGVDVGAKSEIHRLVRDLAHDGAAVLVVSSDLPELLELSDVIHVVKDGRIVGSIPGTEANERNVMQLAAGETEKIA